MPKMKTHKGMKKRFKVSATGKVSHKRCGSSHLMSHKSGKQVRRLRKKKLLNVEAERRRIRHALLTRQGSSPVAIEDAQLAAAVDAELTNLVEEAAAEADGPGATEPNA